MFDDQGNVSMFNFLKIIQCLLANKMFQCLRSTEGGKKNIIFTSFHFLPQKYLFKHHSLPTLDLILS